MDPFRFAQDVTFSFRKVCNKKPVVGFQVGSTPGAKQTPLLK
jgi:hypothetical protein